MLCVCVSVCEGVFMDSDFASHKQNQRDSMDFKAFVGEQDRCKGEFESRFTKSVGSVLKFRFIYLFPFA